VEVNPDPKGVSKGATGRNDGLCFPGCLVNFAGEVEFCKGVLNSFGGEP